MRLIIFLTSLSLFTLAIDAQENLSVEEAIAIGLKNNYQIQIAKRGVEIAKANNSEAAAGRYPKVDLNVGVQNNLNDQNNPASFINGAFYNGGLNGSLDATWVIFDGYKVDVNKGRLAELQNQSEHNVSLAVEGMMKNIMQAYYQILVQQEQLDVLDQLLDLSRDRIRYQEVRKEFGQAGSFDLLQTQDAYLNDSTTYIIQQYGIETAFRNLNIAMGEEDVEKEYTLTDKLTFEPKPYVFEELQSKLYSNNRNVQNLMINRELAKINTDLQRTTKYPRVSLGGGLGMSGSLFKLFATNPQTGDPFELQNGNASNGYINLGLSYNLYNGGAVKRNIQSAELEVLNAQLNIDDLKRQLSAQLQNLLASYNQQLQLINITDRLLENAQQNIDIAQERFKGGQMNSFDYRAIQLSYLNANQSKLNAILNLKNTEIEIMQLVGDIKVN